MIEVRDWHKDMELCQQLNQWYEHPWEAGQEDGSRVIEIYEIIPDEPCNFVAECDNDSTTNFIMESRQALPYWLQQYAAEKERADTLLGANQFYQVELAESLGREKKLREAIEQEIKMGIIWGDYNRADALEELLASLYPEKEEEA